MKLRRILRFGAPYRTGLALALAFQLVETGTVLAIPWVGGKLADDLIDSADIGITAIALALIGLFALRTALRIAGGVTILTVAERLLA